MNFPKTNVPVRGLLLLGAVGLLALMDSSEVAAQTDKQLVRLARLEIYPAQLESYKAAIKEHIETALRVEPGVLTLYAVAEKARPTHITVLEIYASEAAYQAHLKTPHFLKYKSGTQKMVKSLELVETEPLVPNVPVKTAR
jgi:quinol monooxygenase YgiN